MMVEFKRLVVRCCGWGNWSLDKKIDHVFRVQPVNGSVV